jgi:predicted DsbA family dithiol-disulfide isomerase
VTEALAGEAHRAEVLAEDQAARRAGLNGVPSFLLDRHLLFSGAVPAEDMAEAFRRAHAILKARAAG